MESVNPATGECLQRYEVMPWNEVERHLQQAHATFGEWRATSFEQRARLMRQAAAVLRQHAAPYAELMAKEMGKPITQGRQEVEKCAWVCEYYAEHAAQFLAPQPVSTDAQKSFVAFQPLGVVLAVMPWNFPFWQVFRFAAPGLMAGNTCVLKHASNVFGCAQAIEDVFVQAGFPSGAFVNLLIPSGLVDRVIESPHVAAVTLTGSVGAGRAVAKKAGEQLKKVVLELGGSDPYVVLADADVALAASQCVSSRLINGGQSCVSAKRFIVVEAVRQEFERKFVEGMRAYQMTDPLHDDAKLGPMARDDLRDELQQQVQQSIAKGARLLLGGEIPARKGAWYPPTVLTDVKPGMPAYDEEMFGPVAAIISARDTEDAIRIANDSRFGLGAAVFTGDREQGERIAAERLAAGCCFVNTLVKSDPRLPFGGIKESGYGRELSHFGIQEFVNIKSVYVA